MFFIEVAGSDARAVEADARKMAEELLANTVIEGYDVKVACRAEASYAPRSRRVTASRP